MDSLDNLYDQEFWEAVDQLVVEPELVIDRPKGSCHPRYPQLSYPVNYGYLKQTTSMDGGGIDLWLGSNGSGVVDAIICTVDLIKKDSEIKLLLNCNAAEKALVYRFHNESSYMKGILIERNG